MGDPSEQKLSIHHGDGRRVIQLGWSRNSYGDIGYREILSLPFLLSFRRDLQRVPILQRKTAGDDWLQKTESIAYFPRPPANFPTSF